MPGLMTERRYNAGAIALHWIIAAAIIFNLVTGSFMESLNVAQRHIVVTLHTSTGLMILLFSLARVILRLVYRPPPLDETLAPWERAGARATHFLFYVLMIAMPLIGWSINSASTRKVVSTFYFTVPTPKIAAIANLPLAAKTVAHDRFVLAHTVGAWILFALLVIHVAGALKHQFVDRSPQFGRMWFSRA